VQKAEVKEKAFRTKNREKRGKDPERSHVLPAKVTGPHRTKKP